MPRPISSSTIHVRMGQNKMGLSISGVFSFVRVISSGIKRTANF